MVAWEEDPTVALMVAMGVLSIRMPGEGLEVSLKVNPEVNRMGGLMVSLEVSLTGGLTAGLMVSPTAGLGVDPD